MAEFLRKQREEEDKAYGITNKESEGEDSESSSSVHPEQQ